ARGVPEILANSLAALPTLLAAPDIVHIAQAGGRPIAEIAATHFAVGEAFRLAAITAAARDVPAADYYDRLALGRAIDGIAGAHRSLTAAMASDGEAGHAAVARWSEARGAEVARIRSAVDGIVASGLTLSKLTVAASLLGDLARG
ncbi:MAG TPA: NAD-glutamate dehydrogenase, partial [Beijerinckiaceae bacterium]|nr:NAD-glutamate dehydrogenase [Beijerinckiaceae bacterium]